jgi:hypothetical protein
VLAKNSQDIRCICRFGRIVVASDKDKGLAAPVFLEAGQASIRRDDDQVRRPLLVKEVPGMHDDVGIEGTNAVEHSLKRLDHVNQTLV